MAIREALVQQDDPRWAITVPLPSADERRALGGTPVASGGRQADDRATLDAFLAVLTQSLARLDLGEGT